CLQICQRIKYKSALKKYVAMTTNYGTYMSVAWLIHVA
ncbi:MAG: hypothetical protein ACJAWT_001691, partial [Glaciecola sp.]